MSLVGIGDNSGNLDAATQIAENLADRHPDLVARQRELAGMAERVPASVNTQEDADKLSTAVRQCTEWLKNAEGTRVKEKEPYLAGGRSVDGYFQNLAKPITALKQSLERVRTAYDVMVEQAAKQRLMQELQAAEAARKAAEAVARKAALDAETAAQQAMADSAAALAEVKAVAAEEAREATKVKPAKLTRTRTTEGVTTSLRSEWRFEIRTPTAVPRHYCTPNEGLLRAAVKAATQTDGSNSLIDTDGNSLIPGVRIWLHKWSAVR